MILQRRTSLLGLVLVVLFIIVVRLRSSADSGSFDPLSLDQVRPNFTAGTARPASETYSRTLVMGKLKTDDISWVHAELPSLNKSIYVVDDNDPKSEFRVPKNKGHEAMVYLTYIIDNYDHLPDTVLFFHPHKRTWHNNVLLDLDTAKTIKHLSDGNVARKGYFNSRCHHDPGCPDWLHLDRPKKEWDYVKKNEERFFTRKLWRQLHPFAPFPIAISQPCCAQFAVSRDRIRSQPRSEYIRYRNWLLKTKLEDEISGRIMEYTWQYLFTGESELCPLENDCYCDGYGVCFGGSAEYQDWLNKLKEREILDDAVQALSDEGKGLSEIAVRKREQADKINSELNRLTDEAYKRGDEPRNRAIECGRPWKEGDGF